MIPVPLVNPKFATLLAAKSCELRVRGTGQFQPSGFHERSGSVEFDKTNQNTKMDTIHYMETLPDLSWKALKWN